VSTLKSKLRSVSMAEEPQGHSEAPPSYFTRLSSSARIGTPNSQACTPSATQILSTSMISSIVAPASRAPLMRRRTTQGAQPKRALPFQCHPHGEFAQSATEGDNEATAAPFATGLRMVADHNLGQREAQLVRRAGQQGLRLPGDDVGDFSYAIPDQG